MTITQPNSVRNYGQKRDSMKAIIHTLKRHTHYTIHIPRNRPTIDYRTGRLTP